jgi:hypothetical protein
MSKSINSWTSSRQRQQPLHQTGTRTQVKKISKESIDFDAEGRVLWAKINLDPLNKGGIEMSPIDPIFRHPIGAGTIYVGGSKAAKNLKLLTDLGITSVVNCTLVVVQKADGTVKSKRSSKNLLQ